MLVTTPAAVEYTGAPIGAAKSTPLCGMTTGRTGCMRCGLKRDAMRASGTGVRNPPRYGWRPLAAYHPRGLPARGRPAPPPAREARPREGLGAAGEYPPAPAD